MGIHRIDHAVDPPTPGRGRRQWADRWSSSPPVCDPRPLTTDRRRRQCPRRSGGIVWRNPGGVLLSQGATPQVPSALAGLTAVFGMGTGVSPPPWPPETVRSPGLEDDD